MFRIKDEFEYEFEINKSRFICYLKRVTTEDEAKDYITEIQKLHPKATHHCTAVLIDENTQRSNDDGEPSGTAGLPMLEILRNRNMELICAVTVRYYGGIKLGAGGLIRAYAQSVNDALSNTTLYKVQNTDKYSITFGYPYIDQIEHLMQHETILNREFDVEVTFTYLSNNENIAGAIQEITSGKCEPVYLGNVEVELPIKEEESHD